MPTSLQVLSPDMPAQVHERSLDLLRKVGVRVETSRGREILARQARRWMRRPTSCASRRSWWKKP